MATLGRPRNNSNRIYHWGWIKLKTSKDKEFQRYFAKLRKEGLDLFTDAEKSTGFAVHVEDIVSLRGVQNITKSSSKPASFSLPGKQKNKTTPSIIISYEPGSVWSEVKIRTESAMEQEAWYKYIHTVALLRAPSNLSEKLIPGQLMELRDIISEIRGSDTPATARLPLPGSRPVVSDFETTDYNSGAIQYRPDRTSANTLPAASVRGRKTSLPANRNQLGWGFPPKHPIEFHDGHLNSSNNIAPTLRPHKNFHSADHPPPLPKQRSLMDVYRGVGVHFDKPPMPLPHEMHLEKTDEKRDEEDEESLYLPMKPITPKTLTPTSRNDPSFSDVFDEALQNEPRTVSRNEQPPCLPSRKEEELAEEAESLYISMDLKPNSAQNVSASQHPMLTQGLSDGIDNDPTLEDCPFTPRTSALSPSLTDNPPILPRDRSSSSDVQLPPAPLNATVRSQATYIQDVGCDEPLESVLASREQSNPHLTSNLCHELPTNMEALDQRWRSRSDDTRSERSPNQLKKSHTDTDILNLHVDFQLLSPLSDGARDLTQDQRGSSSEEEADSIYNITVGSPQEQHPSSPSHSRSTLEELSSTSERHRRIDATVLTTPNRDPEWNDCNEQAPLPLSKDNPPDPPSNRMVRRSADLDDCFPDQPPPPPPTVDKLRLVKESEKPPCTSPILEGSRVSSTTNPIICSESAANIFEEQPPVPVAKDHPSTANTRNTMIPDLDGFLSFQHLPSPATDGVPKIEESKKQQTPTTPTQSFPFPKQNPGDLSPASEGKREVITVFPSSEQCSTLTSSPPIQQPPLPIPKDNFLQAPANTTNRRSADLEEFFQSRPLPLPPTSFDFKPSGKAAQNPTILNLTLNKLHRIPAELRSRSIRSPAVSFPSNASRDSTEEAPVPLLKDNIPDAPSDVNSWESDNLYECMSSSPHPPRPIPVAPKAAGIESQQQGSFNNLQPQMSSFPAQNASHAAFIPASERRRSTGVNSHPYCGPTPILADEQFTAPTSRDNHPQATRYGVRRKSSNLNEDLQARPLPNTPSAAAYNRAGTEVFTNTSSYQWFVEKPLDRKEAESVLKSNEHLGNLLLRRRAKKKNKDPWQYAVSTYEPSERNPFKHFRIKEEMRGRDTEFVIFLGDEDHPPLRSLNEVVSYFIQTSERRYKPLENRFTAPRNEAASSNLGRRPSSLQFDGDVEDTYNIEIRSYDRRQ